MRSRVPTGIFAVAYIGTAALYMLLFETAMHLTGGNREHSRAVAMEQCAWLEGRYNEALAQALGDGGEDPSAPVDER